MCFADLSWRLVLPISFHYIEPYNGGMLSLFDLPFSSHQIVLILSYVNSSSSAAVIISECENIVLLHFQHLVVNSFEPCTHFPLLYKSNKKFVQRKHGKTRPKLRNEIKGDRTLKSIVPSQSKVLTRLWCAENNFLLIEM